MKIILSPAKKMNVDIDSLEPLGLPVYIDKTSEILAWLRSQSHSELQKLWKCNDKIAEQNFKRLDNMELRGLLTPAVLSYEGIAFQYMAPAVFETEHFEYVQEHLRILSAFYGVLKPMDGVTPYRLEMQARASIGDAKDLYAFWGSKLYEAVRDDSGIIINLASKEYSKCIERYLTNDDTYITITFCEKSGDKLCAKRKLWRISEALLLGMAFCFGAVGAFLSMQLFRHKTRHMKFRYGVPLMLIIQLVPIIGMH